MCPVQILYKLTEGLLIIILCFLSSHDTVVHTFITACSFCGRLALNTVTGRKREFVSHRSTWLASLCFSWNRLDKFATVHLEKTTTTTKLKITITVNIKYTHTVCATQNKNKRTVCLGYHPSCLLQLVYINNQKPLCHLSVICSPGKM